MLMKNVPFCQWHPQNTSLWFANHIQISFSLQEEEGMSLFYNSPNEETVKIN